MCCGLNANKMKNASIELNALRRKKELLHRYILLVIKNLIMPLCLGVFRATRADLRMQIIRLCPTLLIFLPLTTFR
jgi:hypothetical protein